MAGGILVVSGLPASGKTTLAKKLAHDLAFVHLWRDGLKRPLQDVSAALPNDGRNLVGRAIDQLINTVAAEVLRAGHGVVIDSNFNIAEHGDAIRHLAAEHGRGALKCACGATPTCCAADSSPERTRH